MTRRFMLTPVHQWCVDFIRAFGFGDQVVISLKIEIEAEKFPVITMTGHPHVPDDHYVPDPGEVEITPSILALVERRLELCDQKTFTVPDVLHGAHYRWQLALGKRGMPIKDAASLSRKDLEDFWEWMHDEEGA